MAISLIPQAYGTCERQVRKTGTDLRSWAIFAALLVMGGCAGDEPPVRSTDIAPIESKADTIFHGGPIITVTAGLPEARALAVANGHIIAVGDEETVMKRKGLNTKVIDLAGRTLLPGFVEPHTHFLGTMAETHLTNVVLSKWDLPLRTEDEIISMLKSNLPNPPVKNGITQWLNAFGVDPARTNPFMWSLNRKKLDEQVSSTIPIFVMNQSGHIAYVNSAAIKEANIGPSTPDPPGGRYGRDPITGDLTGILYEPPAFTIFQSKMSQPDTKAVIAALHTTVNDFVAEGLTTASELTLGFGGSWEQELALLEANLLDMKTGAIPALRLRTYLDGQSLLAYNKAHPTARQPQVNQGNDMLKIIGVKFFADGSTQGLTAALTEPYSWPRDRDYAHLFNFGQLDNKCLEDFLAEMKLFYSQGWQLSVHSNGDRATDEVLKVYSTLLADSQNPAARAARRLRIEHFTVTRDSQLDQVQKLGVTIGMTIGHVYYWGKPFEDDILGKKRAERIDPSGGLRSRGVHFAFHSDSPISPASPLRYIANGASRHPQGEAPDKVLGPQELISVDDAIRAVTLDAAYQLFMDTEVGSLEVGKLADLVILDKNPRTMMQHPEEIMKILVEETWVAGKPAYRRPQSKPSVTQ